MLAAVRTLLISGETPTSADSGSRLRVLHLARALAGHFDVELAVLGEPGDASGEPFALTAAGHQRAPLSGLATALSRPYEVAKHSSRAMMRLAAGGHWDVVQASQPWMLPAAACTGRPVVLDVHNVEAEILLDFARRERRPLHRARWRWESRKMERWERDSAGRVRAVTATSQADAEAFERYGAREVVLVPNGVDAAGIEFDPPSPGADIVFVGHYGYRPNAYAAAELAEQILPRVRSSVPAARVVLVGREQERPHIKPLGELPGVELAGGVADVKPFLRRSRVTVIPLRTGSGTRLKVLEAMAAGVPVVSTPLGVAGLGLTAGREALLGETPAELAEAATRVIVDDTLAESLARAGRGLVERRYDWPIVAAPLIELHQRVAEGR